MSWHYRPPINFPVLYSEALRSAVLEPNEPYIVISGDRQAVADIAEKFRWFKWCIRHKPEAARDLYHALEQFDIRTAIKEDMAGFYLTLIAKPKIIDILIALNPDLAQEIAFTA